MENKPSTFVFKHDFPIDVSMVPFTRYSYFATSINDEYYEQSPQQQQRNIVIGGRDNNVDGFCELIVDDNRNSIHYKSFTNDYNRKFANSKHIGFKNAHFTRSYLVQNNKYILVFKLHKCYNVYDMENDKWLLKQGEKKLKYFPERGVLINDEIIIGSYDNELYFYFIGNDHITDPVLLHEYTLKTKKVSFFFHGMCIIDFIKQESSKNESQQTYAFKIILFGGFYKQRDFLSSFLYLDILLSYQDIELSSISIDENLIDKNEIKLINTNATQETRRYNFGFECIVNSKNQPVIIMIGGNKSQSIYLFNCVTYELTRHDKVRPLYCV